jgi:mono/diheme cytochrome c family protein
MFPVRSLLGALAIVGMCAARADDAADKHFHDKVKPLLDSRCVSCHGPDKVKGALRLDSRAATLKGGDNGPAVIPGKPDDSLLLLAVMHVKSDLEMPPKEKLTTNDIAVLRRWIADGAPWPATPTNEAASAPLKPGERLGDAWHDPRNPIVKIFGGQRLDLWSLQPVRRVEPPGVKKVISKSVISGAKGGAMRSLNADSLMTDDSPRHPIDQFIQARLTEKKLTPAPEADRRTLARRLYFDLTGLPPAPEQVQEFLNDSRRDAYERLVDKLLASPRYGEHQARLWLDVIRYSDSNGFDWDEFRPKAWRFRDYVVRAFNADKPFDQFIREQLAGDELLAGPPQNESEQDALIATGYLRLGPQDNSAGAFNEQDRSRAELLADLTETTASAFLAMTLSCNRCHDHKYDPLSHADHYRLRAFFEPVKFADDTPIDVAPEQEAIRVQNKTVDEKLQPFTAERDKLLASVKKKLREEKTAKLKDDERALLELPKAQRTNDLKDKVAGLEKKVEPKDKEVQAALTEEQKKQHESLTKQIDALKKERRAFTLALLMTDNPEKIPVTKVLFQGNHKDPRDPVVPGFLSALDPNPAEIKKPLNVKTTGRRLTLADWITSTNHPLTARVFVNRAWQQHFGSGLVATANDFGLAGAKPTHPELLDWLAGEFVRGGWSVKQLHRLMVTSAAYRRGSVISESVNSKSVKASHTAAPITDSLLTDYSHQNIRRLSAEQLRDALLAVSGLLKLEHAGGPPVWPDLPPEILQANPAFLDDNETKTKGWYPSPKTNQNVRSVFLIQKRTVRVPFLETFDLPENSVSCARRNESIVAPQALSLLNSSLTVEASRALAGRVQREAGEDLAKQVNRAFALALQRAPAPDERRACMELVRQRSLAELCRALLNLNEFIYVD